MNNNQIYMMGRITQGMIMAMGMQAENNQRKHLGQSMAYVYDDFQKITEEYGIYHNALLVGLQDE